MHFFASTVISMHEDWKRDKANNILKRMLQRGRQAQRKEHKETKRGYRSAWYKLTLLSTLVSYLCHYTGEEEKKERGESPNQTLSFAVTLDKSIPKIGAPEIFNTCSARSTSHLHLSGSDPAA